MRVSLFDKICNAIKELLRCPVDHTEEAHTKVDFALVRVVLILLFLLYLALLQIF